MTEKRNGFPSAALNLGAKTTGTLAAATPVSVSMSESGPITCAERDAAPLVRFTLASRTGCVWSYPYSYVGLVELPSADRLVIHCNSREIEAIEVTGRGLDEAAKLLATQRLVGLTESDHAAFADDGVCIANITVRYAEKEAGRQ